MLHVVIAPDRAYIYVPAVAIHGALGKWVEDHVHAQRIA